MRAMIDTILKHKAVQNGESSGQQGDPQLTSEEAYAKEQAAAIQGTVDLVERLANENFQLREVLSGLQSKIVSGRRLFENSARSHSLTENHLQLDAFGGGPILGLDQAECSALCTALGNRLDTHCTNIAPHARRAHLTTRFLCAQHVAARLQGLRDAVSESWGSKRPLCSFLLASKGAGLVRAHRLGGGRVQPPRLESLRPPHGLPESAVHHARTR